MYVDAFSLLSKIHPKSLSISFLLCNTVLHVKMSDFVAYGIIQGKNTSARANAFEKWLSVAEYCLELCNYPGFLQVMLGLQHTATLRLHRTADQLSAKVGIIQTV